MYIVIVNDALCSHFASDEMNEEDVFEQGRKWEVIMRVLGRQYSCVMSLAVRSYSAANPV